MSLHLSLLRPPPRGGTHFVSALILKSAACGANLRPQTRVRVSKMGRHGIAFMLERKRSRDLSKYNDINMSLYLA
jgi:hypothetical protein